MENFVKELLKDADLTVVTKKHVRSKYKEHVHRELLPEEKAKINEMVYAFVTELSEAAKQKSSTIGTPNASPGAKEDSPGNKENKQTNEKSSTFIIKGQVVDRNDLYKSKSKDKQKHSLDEKPGVDEVRKKPDSSEKIKAGKTVPTKQQAAAAKLRINEVMSAVLGPDKGDSSSEVSSVSSLTDTSLSEDEEGQTEEQIQEALQKLKAARDQKIQMSLEKKKKNKKDEKGNQESKARRSLAKENPKFQDLDAGEESETVSIITISSITSETAQDSVAENGKDKRKKIKSQFKQSLKPDSDTGELTVMRTPKSYEKHKSVATRMFDELSEKKKKLVKRKRKNIVEESDSDSDSDASELATKQKHVKLRTKSTNNQKEITLDTDTDSENETLHTIAARKNRKLGSTKNNLEKEKDVVKKTREILVTKKSSKLSADTDSESSTWDTPLAKKKSKVIYIDSVSDNSSGDTPLIQKKRKKRLELDSGSETDDTPLARKRTGKQGGVVKKIKNDKELEVKKSIKGKDLRTDREGSGKSSGKKGKVGVNKTNKDLSESSSGDTPLSKIKEKQIVSKLSDTKQTKADSFTNGKKRRKLSESSNASTGNSSAVERGKRQKIEESREADESDLGDASTGECGDTRKKYELRNRKFDSHLDLSDKDKDSKTETPDERVGEYDAGNKEEDDIKAIGSVQELCEYQEDNTICDNKGETDSPLKKIKGRRKKSTCLESSSDEESTGKKRSVKKKPSQQVNGTSSPSEETSEDETQDSGTQSTDSDSDDIPLAQISKQSIKTRVYEISSDSEDDIPLSKTKAAQSKHTDKEELDLEEASGPVTDNAYVRILRKICRECQMFVRNDRELAGCNTDKEKIDKMELMLRNVGMKGKPSLKKAEEVKLMKEAKELSADNIISSETGRVMRKVKSIWARRTISPVKPAKSAGPDPFAGLKDIVSSEGTESGGDL